MIRAALVLAFAGAACAQTPTIDDYQTKPDILGASVGTLVCNVYAQRPAPGELQMWCTLNGVTVLNAVLTVAAVGFACSVVNPSVDIALAVVPATSPMIGYQLAAEVHNQGPPLSLGPLAAPTLTIATKGGTF